MDTCLVQSFTNRINLTWLENLSIILGLSVTCPVILILNSILIICLVKTKELRNAHGVLLLLLSVSDCFIGLVTIPLQIVLFTLFRKHPACTMESISHAFSYSTIHFSGYMIAVISFHRNVHINPNLTLQNGISRFLVKKTGLTILVVVTVIVTFIQTLVSVILYDKFIPRLVLAIIDAVIITYVFVTYFWVYFKVWNFSKTITTAQIQPGGTADVREYPLAKTVALILISAAVCFFPYNILVGLRWRRQRQGREVSIGIQYGIYLSLILLYCNSAINAAIIIFRSTKVREYIASVLGKRREGRSDTMRWGTSRERLGRANSVVGL